MSGWEQALAAWPWEWAEFAFMRHALAAVVILAPIFALIGGLVISNRMAFYADALGHASLTGVAIGVLLGVRDPMAAMLGFAILLALVITALRRQGTASTDTVIGLTMAVAVAVGVVILSRGGGFGKFTRFLVGDILTLTRADLGRLLILAGVTLGCGILFFNAVFLTTLNRSLALSRGVPVWRVEAGFAVFTAVVVTICIPWLGLLVVNALLILPAAAARNVARNTASYFAWAAGISLASGVVGLIASFYWGTAAGATIVLFGGLFYGLSLATRWRGQR